MSKSVNVGIIGIGGWASYGHMPLLQLLPQYKINAVLSRSLERAQSFAKKYDIPFAFDQENEFFAHPDIDLVVITTPGPEHYQFAKKAILAGKNVYSEWPLTTSTEQSQELLTLAKENNVHHIVSLQRRFSPSARYFKDLLDAGYVGKIRSVRMSVGVDAFAPAMPSRYAWTFDPKNYTNVLTIYSGHFSDMLFHIVGQPQTLFALTENQFPYVDITDTGEKAPYSSPNEVMMMGSLAQGGLYSVHIEGAQKNITGLQIEITGTNGVLRMSNERGFQNTADNTIEGMQNEEKQFSEIAIPQEYITLPENNLDASVQDVGYLYQAYINDLTEGTTTVTTFEDAVRQHEIIDRVLESDKSLRKILEG